MNLEKLKAFEMPFWEKDVFLLGEVQKVKIYALHDRVGIEFSRINTNDKSSQVKILPSALADCLRISLEDAIKICDVDFSAAAEIFSFAMEITKEYHEKRKQERENALKNLQMAQGMNMHN